MCWHNVTGEVGDHGHVPDLVTVTEVIDTEGATPDRLQDRDHALALQDPQGVDITGGPSLIQCLDLHQETSIRLLLFGTQRTIVVAQALTAGQEVVVLQGLQEEDIR